MKKALVLLLIVFCFASCGTLQAAEPPVSLIKTDMCYGTFGRLVRFEDSWTPEKSVLKWYGSIDPKNFETTQGTETYDAFFDQLQWRKAGDKIRESFNMAEKTVLFCKPTDMTALEFFSSLRPWMKQSRGGSSVKGWIFAKVEDGKTKVLPSTSAKGECFMIIEAAYTKRQWYSIEDLRFLVPPGSKEIKKINENTAEVRVLSKLIIPENNNWQKTLVNGENMGGKEVQPGVYTIQIIPNADIIRLPASYVPLEGY